MKAAGTGPSPDGRAVELGGREITTEGERCSHTTSGPGFLFDGLSTFLRPNPNLGAKLIPRVALVPLIAIRVGAAMQ